MSVKPPLFRLSRARSRPPPSLVDRVLGFLLADWWIDVLLMVFIVMSMLFLHQ
jgi:hypothetical protein